MCVLYDYFGEGFELKVAIPVLLIFLATISIAGADVYNDSIYSEEKSLTLTVESNVKGDGYYKDYQYIKMDNVLEPSEVTSNGVQAKNYAHGSGRLNSESLLSAVSSHSTSGAA
jgi:hypothetical protein